MTSDWKMLVHALYRSAVVPSQRLSIAGASLKLHFTPRDVGNVVADWILGIATKDTIKQRIL